MSSLPSIALLLALVLAAACGETVKSRTCITTAGGQCSCPGTPPPPAPTVGTCGPETVAADPAQTGICCVNDTNTCSCFGFACADDGKGLCVCGILSFVRGMVPGSALVAACPAPTAGQKCCRTTTGSCSCGTRGCAALETDVPTCTVADTVTCFPQNLTEKVDRCN
jgi:hypothetical protein